MNDALYGVPQVASALLGIHARVNPLVHLIRALAHLCNRRPRLFATRTNEPHHLHEDQIRSRWDHPTPKGPTLRASCHLEVGQPLAIMLYAPPHLRGPRLHKVFRSCTCEQLNLFREFHPWACIVVFVAYEHHSMHEHTLTLYHLLYCTTCPLLKPFF